MIMCSSGVKGINYFTLLVCKLLKPVLMVKFYNFYYNESNYKINL